MTGHLLGGAGRPGGWHHRAWRCATRFCRQPSISKIRTQALPAWTSSPTKPAKQKSNTPCRTPSASAAPTAHSYSAAGTDNFSQLVIPRSVAIEGPCVPRHHPKVNIKSVTEYLRAFLVAFNEITRFRRHTHPNHSLPKPHFRNSHGAVGVMTLLYLPLSLFAFAIP